MELKIAQLQPEHVLSIYNGRPGCCCGCKGKHIYNPAFQSEGSKTRGYKVTDDECNTESIKRSLNRIKKRAATEPVTDDRLGLSISTGSSFNSHIAYETETRLNIVYLRKGVTIVS